MPIFFSSNGLQWLAFYRLEIHVKSCIQAYIHTRMTYSQKWLKLFSCKYVNPFHFSNLNQNHKFQVHVAFTRSVDTMIFTQSGSILIDGWAWLGDNNWIHASMLSYKLSIFYLLEQNIYTFPSHSGWQYVTALSIFIPLDRLMNIQMNEQNSKILLMDMSKHKIWMNDTMTDGPICSIFFFIIFVEKQDKTHHCENSSNGQTSIESRM